MTSGSEQSAVETRPWWQVHAFYPVAAAVLAVATSLNVATIRDDMARLGHAIEAWEPWVLEGTSAVAWLCVLPLIVLAVDRFQPPRMGWLRGLALHLVMTVGVSVAHVLLMTGAREILYAVRSESYGADLDLGTFLYEYRKDVITYLLWVALLALTRHFIPRAPVAPAAADAPQPAGQEPLRLEIRDGPRIVWVQPDEIFWAEAAGNYVELHTTQGVHLHRTTLSALEERLKDHGLVRIHRSRLVNAAAVRALTGSPSGDFTVTLVNGASVTGSRRYRDQLRHV